MREVFENVKFENFLPNANGVYGDNPG